MNRSRLHRRSLPRTVGPQLAGPQLAWPPRLAFLGTLLAALIGAGPVGAQTTWTVDASGGADFLQLTDAVAAAADGDRILVAPTGIYDPVTTSKSLEILGPVGPVAPWVRSITAIGAQDLRLAGLRCDFVRLEGTTGDVLVADSNLIGSPTGESLQIIDCAGVLVQSCDVRGVTDDGLTSFAEEAVRVVDAYVEIVDSELIGGDGYMPICIGCGETDGAIGLDVRGTSRVVLSRTSVFGGQGGSVLGGSTTADAVEVRDSSWVRARGTSNEWIQSVRTFHSALFEHTGINPPTSTTAQGGSTIGAIAEELFLVARAGGTPAPGQREVLVDVHGPAGGIVALFATLAVDDPAALRQLGVGPSPLWLNPTQLAIGGPTAVLLTGLETPVVQSYTVPAIPGVEIWFQSFERLTASVRLTNPTAVVLR